MTKPVRMHRVKAFCDWLDIIPPQPPFHTLPEFRFYEDLTQAEINAAQVEMRRRSSEACAEADRLRGEMAVRFPPAEQMVPDAILHLKVRTSGMPRGDVAVSADALNVVLSYLEYLEERLDIIPTPGPEAA